VSLPRRFSRRTLFAGGVAAAGALGAGAAVVVGRSGSSAPASPTPTPRPGTVTPEPTPTPLPTPTPFPRGGIIRLAAPQRFNFDTFDAQRSGEPSVIEVLGRTHSRLVEWSDFQAPTIGPGLAARWEQPDERTLLLHIDPAARWHDRPGFAARPVSAADVVEHLRRSLEVARSGTAPLSQRYADYSSFEQVDSPAAGVVRIALSAPDPFAFATLAGEFALVQSPEAVARLGTSASPVDETLIAGSGAFLFDGARDGSLVFKPAPGGHAAPPIFDELHVSEPFDLVGRFNDGDLDEVITRDRRDAAAIRATGLAEEYPRFERETVMTSLDAGAPPWNIPTITSALSGALNRFRLADELFGGRATPSGPVPPVHSAFALTEGVLAIYPGYRRDPAEDARDARKRWEAAAGPSLGAITVDFPSVFDPLYSASSIVIGILNEVLGNQFRAAVETYTTISQRVRDGYYGNGRAAFWFGWGPPLPSPDPRRAFIERYRGLPGLPAGLSFERAATLDSTLRDRTEVHDLQQVVIQSGFGGVIPWVQQRSELFRRKGVSGPWPSPFWDYHLDAARYVGR
jgi:ABC-type transport system substrate-binding protein